MSLLQEKLDAGDYVVTSEIAPPKGPDMEEFLEKARIVKGRVVAVNVTDNQRALMRLSSLIGSEFLRREGIEPIYQLTCRDRNRLALQSDLLGAAAFGIENVLALTGDGMASGDQKESKAVFDLNSVKMLEMIRKLNEGLTYHDKPLNAKTRYYAGAAVDLNNFGSEAFRFKFEQKIAAGARFFQSQPIYDLGKAEHFHRYLETFGAKNLIGVILVKSAQQARFLNKIPGIKIPDSVIDRFERYESREDAIRVGVDYAAEQLRAFRAISHGVHIMTVGREDLVPEILARAGF